MNRNKNLSLKLCIEHTPFNRISNLLVSKESIASDTKKHPTQSVGRSINVDIIVLINVLRIEKLYEPFSTLVSYVPIYHALSCGFTRIISTLYLLSNRYLPPVISSQVR